MNIGIDIEECNRFEKFAFMDKVFSPNELEYIKSKHGSIQTIAGLYSAKEAYLKAVGTGIIKSKLPEVEIGHDAQGRPYYINNSSATLSISHTKSTAVSVCIIF